MIAGDGAVERMLLTGMAGDLAQVAHETTLPLQAVQSAVRGDTLPYHAATNISSTLDRLILKNTRLVVSTAVLNLNEASRGRREAVNLGNEASKRYLIP